MIIPAMAVFATLTLVASVAPAFAQETDFEWLSLDVKAIITHTERERDIFVDRYTFTIQITNPGQEIMFADVLYLNTNAYYDNDCELDYWVEIHPGETKTLLGCYVVDSGELPVYITIYGYMDTDSLGVIRTAVIPFESYGCAHASNNTNCLPLHNIDYIVDNSALDIQPEPSDFAVNNAQYVWDDNILILNFTGKINLSSINMSGISITDSRCALTFTWRDYDMSSLDRTSVIIRPNDIHRESLASMTEPYIQFREGSFVESGTDNRMASDIMPVRMVGDPPPGNHKCILTYGSNEFLLDVYTVNYAETMQAVHDGFTAWSDLNPQLEFVHVDKDPLIWIDWVEYTPEYLGLACVWCLYNEPSMEVVLYGYDCRGTRIYHDTGSVRNTVAHELGHILGLDHHTNQTHLMYGPEYQVDPYETHGYVVPEDIPWGFVGETELYEQIQMLKDKLDGFTDGLDKLEAKGNLVGNVLYFTQKQADQYEQLIDMYNVVRHEYNAVWQERNCMYEARVPGH